jgi:DNA transformation protein and related proteins
VSPEDIRELFVAFGAVSVRRLFGGAGVFAEGAMFALTHKGVVYLKADDGNAAAFDREGLGVFTYATRDGKRGLSSYRRMPDRLYDDPDELAIWARDALAAARRASQRRKPGPGSKSPSKPKKRSRGR